jgi:hypothetical protein
MANERPDYQRPAASFPLMSRRISLALFFPGGVEISAPISQPPVSAPRLRWPSPLETSSPLRRVTFQGHSGCRPTLGLPAASRRKKMPRCTRQGTPARRALWRDQVDGSSLGWVDSHPQIVAVGGGRWLQVTPFTPRVVLLHRQCSAMRAEMVARSLTGLVDGGKEGVELWVGVLEGALRLC